MATASNSLRPRFSVAPGVRRLWPCYITDDSAGTQELAAVDTNRNAIRRFARAYNRVSTGIRKAIIGDPIPTREAFSPDAGLPRFAVHAHPGGEILFEGGDEALAYANEFNKREAADQAGIVAVVSLRAEGGAR